MPPLDATAPMNGAIVRPRRCVCPWNREPLSGTNWGLLLGEKGVGEMSQAHPVLLLILPYPPLPPTLGWLAPITAG